jgi:hypothetical protein
MYFKNILVVIYSHPEFFPPTLNAVDELSTSAASITVLARNVKSEEWQYPANVKLHLSGAFKPIGETEKASLPWKIWSFLQFTANFFKLLRKYQPEWVVCYDSIPLLSFRLANLLLNGQWRLWYHNHDVYETGSAGRFSISGMAITSEKNYFHHINLFTLPSEERIEYFPINKLKGVHFILPNYPSKRRTGHFSKEIPDSDSQLKLIYQGHIGEGHGLDEIIIYLNNRPDISLTIIGYGDSNTIKKLKLLIVNNLQIRILPPIAYSKLAQLTRDHHVGLAIHKPVNTAFRTAALASNKIYEYAASGLAILYYDDEHYKKHLGKYAWAFPNDLSSEKLDHQFAFIRKNYKMLSSAALSDFETSLNYEFAFQAVHNFLVDEKKIS